MKNLVNLTSLLFLILSSVIVGGQRERIISYDSKIVINKDGSMLVTEIIKVHSEGNKIKRGIYRDFPTDYKDKYGNNIRITFDVVDVLKDGRKEAFHTERKSNGIRVYCGKSSHYLKPGDYTYAITYKTDRQLGYFKEHDELYWNVTGNGWDFEIEYVTATVFLPKGINRNEIIPLAFTGSEGSKGKNYRAEVLNNGVIKIVTTHKLFSREGLTIVVQFPKGFVFEPDFRDKLGYYIQDNKAGIAVIIGSLLLCFYYIISWLIVGRDPTKGTIIPLYEPPAKLSPAAVRFIHKLGFDDKAFTAAVIDLCVKGNVILEEDNKEYKLIKNESGSNEKLSSDERKLIAKLNFKNTNGKSILELKQKNHANIKASIKALKKSLQNSFERQYFFTNKKFFIVGIVISIISLIVGGMLGNEELVFIMIWNVFWSLGVSVLLYTVFKSWRTALSGKVKGAAYAGAIFITLFAIPFAIGMLVGLYFLSQVGSVLLIFGILLIVLINIIFHHLLKAPTLLGRKIMDRIDGFKMYLSVAEQQRLDRIKEPEKTPELFEKLLPYAIALDVENQWGEKFESLLQKAGTGESSYSPTWYAGSTAGILGASALTSSLGSSLTSSISSSSTAPGSSSGSGGGGFSGGGGGGGGGGGW